MKNLLLNDIILGLNGETVITNSGRYRVDENGERTAEATPIKFATIALSKIIRSRTTSDDEAKNLFSLSNKLNENLKSETPTEMQLSDEEFTIVKNAIDTEAVIVKARFIEMVESLNA